MAKFLIKVYKFVYGSLMPGNFNIEFKIDFDDGNIKKFRAFLYDLKKLIIFGFVLHISKIFI